MHPGRWSIDGETYDAAMPGTAAFKNLHKTSNSRLALDPDIAEYEVWHGFCTPFRGTYFGMLILVAYDTGCHDALMTFSREHGVWMSYNFGEDFSGLATHSHP